jgi:uncharacterized protein
MGVAVACLRPSSLNRAAMTTKRHVPRVNSEFARFNLHIRRSRIERFGVFTEETIPPGKKVIEYTGERISGQEANRRAIKALLAGKAERVYLVPLNRRSKLDGSVGGSGAEFINHSCDPNLTARRTRGQIFLYSFRKIRAGEELTVDYGFRCSNPCHCGSSKCRGTMCHV